MAKLRIRAYNVLFGDAILISFSEKDEKGSDVNRNILIDVGNLSRIGGSSEVFPPVIENILEVLSGNPLDLYIMTHEHMDHVKGLLSANNMLFKKKGEPLSEKLKTRYTWLTGSAEKNYYEKHPDAKKKKLAFDEAYKRIDGYINAAKATPEGIPKTIENLWLNNNYSEKLLLDNSTSTADCVDYIRSLSLPENTFYVYRGFDLGDHHPFGEAKIEIWAPEEDTSDYYPAHRLAPMALGVTNPSEESKTDRPTLTEILPPAGVYAGAFYRLLRTRRRCYDNLLAIDKAANNTSIVFCLEWHGLKLLFTGDAEEDSWEIMNNKGVLKQVNFLKTSHHGSVNGTPKDRILEKILPKVKPDDKPRKSLLSTYPEIGNKKEEVYDNVPDGATVDIIRERSELYEVHKKNPGEYLDIIFEVEE